MITSGRIELPILEEDPTSDEELPVYEPSTAPEYDSADFEVPLHTYLLHQLDRRIQVFVPSGRGPTYHVLSRGSLQMLFSKKAEIEVWRSSQDVVGSVSFVNDGPFPWRPRARFSYANSCETSMTAVTMEAKNFSDWTLAMDDFMFVWQLESRPTSLVLKEKSARLIVARFTYSACGVRATKGEEIGELMIFRDGLSMDREGVEKILCSLTVPIAHFKKMGKHFRNEGSETRLLANPSSSGAASFASDRT